MSSSTTPLVSVVVPIYKVEPYLRDCLESIRNQSYTNLEIILVDDGSPDNCPAICDAYAELDRRIKVIHKGNGGLSDARNCGIDIATGEKIVFVDSDDIIAPSMIETLINNCPDERSVAATSFLRFIDGEQPCSTESSERILCPDIQSFTRKRSGMFVWGVLYDRAMIEKIGLRFDTSLRNLEDVAWNMIYLSHVEKMYFISSKMCFYRQNPTSITSRCIDKPWQVHSWFAVRNSVFAWFAMKKNTDNTVVHYTWRYCMNNIFAEATVGKLKCSEYVEQRMALPEPHIKSIEIMMEKLLPRLYFCMYMGLMWLKNRIRL